MNLSLMWLEDKVKDITPINEFVAQETENFKKENKITNIVLGIAGYAIGIYLILGCGQAHLLKNRLLDRKLQ